MPGELAYLCCCGRLRREGHDPPPPPPPESCWLRLRTCCDDPSPPRDAWFTCDVLSLVRPAALSCGPLLEEGGVYKQPTTGWCWFLAEYGVHEDDLPDDPPTDEQLAHDLFGGADPAAMYAKCDDTGGACQCCPFTPPQCWMRAVACPCFPSGCQADTVWLPCDLVVQYLAATGGTLPFTIAWEPFEGCGHACYTVESGTYDALPDGATVVSSIVPEDCGSDFCCPPLVCPCECSPPGGNVPPAGFPSTILLQLSGLSNLFPGNCGPVACNSTFGPQGCTKDTLTIPLAYECTAAGTMRYKAIPNTPIICPPMSGSPVAGYYECGPSCALGVQAGFSLVCDNLPGTSEDQLEWKIFGGVLTCFYPDTPTFCVTTGAMLVPSKFFNAACFPPAGEVVLWASGTCASSTVCVLGGDVKAAVL